MSKRIIWPVLMVDDEFKDIEHLERILDGVASRVYISGDASLPDGIRHYAAHPADAVRQMRESMGRRFRYSAIICDNHMQGEDYDAVRGEDFLRAIQGYAGFALTRQKEDLDLSIYDFHSFEELFDACTGYDEEVADFLESSFNGKIGMYQGLVEYFFGQNSPRTRIVLLCGNPRGVLEEGLEDVIKIQKRGGCELEVLGEMTDILPQAHLTSEINEDYILSKNAHPNQRTFKPSSADKIKRKLRKKK